MANRNSKSLRRKEGSDMAAYNVTPGNFWDIGNYSRSVKRINDSCAFNDTLIKMFADRADIETKYSKKLTDWHARWTKILETSPMYATMKTAALGSLKEAEDRSKIHMECWSKLHDQVVETIKRHKESHYHHKPLLGIKEARDYEEEFSKSQKPWAAAYTKVQRAKKNYHSACKQLETSKQNLSVANNDSETPLEKIKKFEEAVQKCEKNVEAAKRKYEEKLSRIEPLNQSYEDEMRKVYSRWAKDEERRKDFLQRTLVDYHKAVNICSDNRLKECFDNQLNVAYSGKSQYDVKWWSENFGADMPRNWPKFEELGDLPELPPPVSAVEPPPSHAYQTQSSYQQVNHEKMQQQQQSFQPAPYQPAPYQPEPYQPSSYQPEPDPAANPFVNGDDKDGDDDDWDEPPPLAGGGVPVRALYDYNKVEDDELSFNAGDILTKLTEEDEQGWCRGNFNGQEGLYPANYVEPI